MRPIHVLCSCSHAPADPKPTKKNFGFFSFDDVSSTEASCAADEGISEAHLSLNDGHGK
jgi:hypothetical protein